MSKRDKELMEYYDLKFAISSESSWDKTLDKYGTKGFFTGTTQNHVMLEASRETKDDTLQDHVTQESRSNCFIDGVIFPITPSSMLQRI
jgi:hypothetical protein